MLSSRSECSGDMGCAVECSVETTLEHDGHGLHGCMSSRLCELNLQHAPLWACTHRPTPLIPFETKKSGSLQRSEVHARYESAGGSGRGSRGLAEMEVRVGSGKHRRACRTQRRKLGRGEGGQGEQEQHEGPHEGGRSRMRAGRGRARPTARRSHTGRLARSGQTRTHASCRCMKSGLPAHLASRKQS